MRISALGDDFTDITDPYPGDAAGNALVLQPGVVSTSPSSTWNWGFLTPWAPVVNNLITQNGLTTRQQQAIAAGQLPAGAQSTLFGIPVLYLLIGAAVVVMVKK